MSDEAKEQVYERDVITATERKRVFLWAIALVVVFATATILTSWSIYSNKIAAIDRHNDRMNPEKGEGGTNPPAAAADPSANPVQTGIYVDRVVDLSVKNTSWTVDFYLWFRWKGNGADPGEKLQIVDGAIESKEKVDEYLGGGEHYVLYRVVANDH